MADNFDRYDNEGSGGGFMMGLLTGTVLGAGLGMLLAPRAGADMRGQLSEQARNIGNMASEQYKKAADTASGWADRGRQFVDKAREAVSRGAEETRGYAGSASGSSYPSQGGSSYTGGSSGSFGGGSTPGSDYGRSGGSSGSGSDFGRS